MARPVSNPERAPFQTSNYVTSWAANNAYYAGNVGYNFTMGNQYTRAAVYSGVVNTGGYTGSAPANKGHATQTARSPRGFAYDRYGNPKQQKGSIALGQVLMGGYQFPGQAFAPKQVGYGTWVASDISMFLQSQGAGGTSYNYLRARNRGPDAQEKGWQTKLSTAQPYTGKGSSSVYQGVERYSTQETRMGKNITEDPNSGFKALGKHSSDQHYISSLSQMYKEENKDIGFARRNT